MIKAYKKVCTKGRLISLPFDSVLGPCDPVDAVGTQDEASRLTLKSQPPEA